MNEITRKYYITQGENHEKASEYKDALASYKEAFSIKEYSKDDDQELFVPGFLEDKIAFLAYRIGEFKTALDFGIKAKEADESDQRLSNNVIFYNEAVLFTNPREKFDNYLIEYLNANYSETSTILDINAYDGKWSYYLHDHFKTIDAIEELENIEKFELRKKYNKIFAGNVKDLKISEHYDIIIIDNENETVSLDSALIKKLEEKCDQLVIITPYKENYSDEQLKLFVHDEVRCVYLKTYDGESTVLTYNTSFPKTLDVGLTYLKQELCEKALGVFNNSLEDMTEEQEALMDYYTGISNIKIGKTLEALKAFSEAVHILPSFKSGYLELFKLLEKLEFWNDLEHYLRLALEHKDETNGIDIEQKDWLAILLIQMTLTLFKQNKNFEAYGYAALAIEAPMGEERKKIAQYNFDELKKTLWSTLQLC